MTIRVLVTMVKSYTHHTLELLVLTRLAPERMEATQHCHIHGTTSRHVNSVFNKHVLPKVSKRNPFDVIHAFYIHFKPLLSVEADLSMLSWGVFHKNLLLQVVPGDAEHDKLIDHFLTQQTRFLPTQPTTMMLLLCVASMFALMLNKVCSRCRVLLLTGVGNYGLHILGAFLITPPQTT